MRRAPSTDAEIQASKEFRNMAMDYRKITGKTRSEIAEDLGVNPSYLSSLTVGRTLVNKDVFARLQKLLDDVLPEGDADTVRQLEAQIRRKDEMIADLQFAVESLRALLNK